MRYNFFCFSQKCNLYYDCAPGDYDEQKIRSVFATVGDVVSVFCKPSRKGGKFGYVEMKNSDSIEKCLALKIEGAPDFFVKMSQPPKTAPTVSSTTTMGSPNQEIISIKLSSAITKEELDAFLAKRMPEVEKIIAFDYEKSVGTLKIKEGMTVNLLKEIHYKGEYVSVKRIERQTPKFMKPVAAPSAASGQQMPWMNPQMFSAFGMMPTGMYPQQQHYQQQPQQQQQQRFRQRGRGRGNRRGRGRGAYRNARQQQQPQYRQQQTFPTVIPVNQGASLVRPQVQPQHVGAVAPTTSVPVVVKNDEKSELIRAIASADKDQHKALIGDKMFYKIQEILVNVNKSDSAPKITGMLLELAESELLDILFEPASLKAKVDEALTVLEPVLEQQ
eukprot:TRINITY_DN3098_c1_g3_i1.p1 TRINITY_DN3098_c1_g3~~TRINITY_DN3098_c1_g3_i1.p1  ORF type:complete len:388 (-),score=148.12 TRINITY_DN3098_c1_g3_i1:215-1378(-)